MEAKDVTSTLIIIAIIYFLYKKGITKQIKFPTIHNKLVLKRDMNRKLSMSYKTYNGVENYLFFMKQAKSYTLKYDVKVKAGSLILICKKGKDVLFEKKFTQDEQGAISFTAEHKRYNLLVIGNYTKGGCYVEFIPHSNEVINE
ncbi:hypothetical protein SH601_14490 [Gracilibacillus sp. S3-1-1]|uniref:Uncharacterized protein n=1 Tax=Gracilibacillus pellucidus TaxID=3095368 RepID=A0ACC6M8E1_9BACI|nr:hypothetical protein [Gracilibacillus sp. S3-1-1]MDX8047195.1 hypothetical protein [Gracilibacillus sp. S3-1-1]